MSSAHQKIAYLILQDVYPVQGKHVLRRVKPVRSGVNGNKRMQYNSKSIIMRLTGRQKHPSKFSSSKSLITSFVKTLFHQTFVPYGSYTFAFDTINTDDDLHMDLLRYCK